MRRYYNKGSLVGGQVKLDKMGNNDGKISGEDFAVIRSKKMDGGMMKEAKEINSKIKNSRTLKMGGGMMKRPMYKEGTPIKEAEVKKKKSIGRTFLDTFKNIKKTQDAMRKDRIKMEKRDRLKEKLREANFEGFSESLKIPKKRERLDDQIIANEKEVKMMRASGLLANGGRVKRAGGGSDTHVTKDGRTVKKGLYYYMNRAKKNKTSKPGKGTVTDKALKQSAKTAQA